MRETQAIGTRDGHTAGRATAGQLLVERARKVLLHEQRTAHADSAVKPGGLESFINRWQQDMRLARTRGDLGIEGEERAGRPPEEAISHLLAGYRALDPMQRAAKVRAAIALLDALDGRQAPHGPAAPSHQPAAEAREGKDGPRSAASATATRPRTAALNTPPSTHAAPAHDAAGDEPWTLATPLRALPKLPGDRANTSVPQHAPRPEDEYLLQAPVSAVPGVGPTQMERLNRLGVATVRDLLFYLPREYRDYSKLEKIGELPFDVVATVVGTIWDVQEKRNGRVTRIVARVVDETGAVNATWFNQRYLLKQLPRGAPIVLTGVKRRFGNSVNFDVKSHELPDQGELLSTGRLVPVYGLTEGLNPKVLRRYTKWAIDHCASFLPDHLPASIRARATLMTLPQAIAQVHFPDGERERDDARRRLAFDELFLLQLGMLTRRANFRDGPPAPAFALDERLILREDATETAGTSTDRPAAPALVGSGLWPLTASCFEDSLPFALTGAQRRSIREILADLCQTKPMTRLLQGDVGSGKTVVAAASLLAAAASGYQGALLAPTEILAEQHYRGLSQLLEPFGLRVVMLTGSQKAKERNAAREALASGTAAVAVGTHALIQDDVAYEKLGLAIVDEQHRFGVEQRDALRRKGNNPHMLVMTATPIPRTLALTLYGDLDISVLDEMPAGRIPIETCWRAGGQRQEAYEQLTEEVAVGRQAYIICPLVEESETLEAKSAIKEYERLQKDVFPELRLGLVHGQLKPAEKDRVMRAFRDGEVDVLVATAVVEVGVDVPNATVMLIEDAERFGLSQLHQFRGRVGRGQHQSYCYLLSQDASQSARERLGVLERTADGFLLAEEDLRLRGPGDFFGTRQSGLPDLKVATMADTRLLSEARRLAEHLWHEDPYLRALEHAPLRERVFLFWRDFAAH